MTNPPCIKCKKNKCICNSEINCGSCKYCSWCIDKHMNGTCIENNKYNRHNCPYSFNINKWKYPKYELNDVKILYKNDYKLSIFKYLFIILLILLIIITIIIIINSIKNNNKTNIIKKNKYNFNNY